MRKSFFNIRKITGLKILVSGIVASSVLFLPQEVHASNNPDIGNRSSSPYSYIYGNGYWPTSSIREWLNSDESSGNVIYTNEPPSKEKLGSQAYDQEAGFLYEFTKEEKEGIAITERRAFVYSALGSKAKDGGSGNVPRYDGLVPSNNIHISSPNIDKVWKNLNYQVVREKVFLLGIHEMFEYVQKRGYLTKKGLSDEAKNRYNISSSSYHYATSTYNYSNTNSETIWAYNSNGYGTDYALTNQFGIVPALHLKPNYKLNNGKLAKNLEINDVVTFGRYNGHPIEWRVINKTPEGYPLLWSEKILTLKRYDAPGDKVLRNSISVVFEHADVSIKDDLKFTNGSSDTTTPYLRVVDDTNLNIRQNSSFSLTIEAVDHESGIDYMILPNGQILKNNKITYEFTENKRYYFTAVDKASNHYGFEVPVGNINPPASVIVTPSANGWTNKDVEVDIKTNQANTDWYLKGPRQTAPNYSGPRMPEYTTYAGKRYRISGKVRLVSAKDSRFNAVVRMSHRVIIPFGNNYRVSYTYPAPISIPLRNLSTNEFTSFETIYTVSGNYFDALYPSLSITHGNIERGNYRVEWKDIEVELLDKEDFRIEKIMLPNGQDVYADSYVDVLTEEGTYTYRVLDSRGKITEKTVTVKIDKVKPDIQITKNTSSPTSGNIVLNITTSDDRSGVKRVRKPNGEWDYRSSFTYNVYENGSYSFTVEDNAGNQTTKTITIENIDREPPQIEFSLSEPSWTNKEIIINVQALDNTEVDYIVTPDGDTIKGNKATFRVNRNGNYTFEVYDTSGNKSVKTISVTNIDHGEPKLNIVEKNKTPSKTEIKLEYSDQ